MFKITDKKTNRLLAVTFTKDDAEHITRGYRVILSDIDRFVYEDCFDDPQAYNLLLWAETNKQIADLCEKRLKKLLAKSKSVRGVKCRPSKRMR